MGQVYRATDTNLKRQVAIKVLPASVALDPDRLARFQREAEVLAALNHPHIAAIYGLEKTPDLTALVMELVEGDDLSQRIARGAIPLDEALPIAKQIAEALEAAHEQGIIHRDLKPANIKVRADGTVKVLDFGLAKAIDANASSATADAMNSPTITSPAMTQAGMILGTAAYMAPEQARGKAVDKRADIWAFGAVLYEMLTGTRAFEGEDIADTLGNVMKVEPNWARCPVSIPPRVVQVMRACLQKNPRQRMGELQSVRLGLEGAFETAAPQTATAETAAPRGRLAWMAFGVAAIVAAALAIPALRYLRQTPSPPPPETRLEISTPSTDQPGHFALSPDGRQVVFVASGDGASRLWVRSLATAAVQPLAGTDGATWPFWSPDGRSVGFFAGGALKRLDLGGGAPQTLAPVPVGFGGTWSADGVIVFAPSLTTALRRVSATGGAVTDVTTLGPQQAGHGTPFFLPDGRRFLFAAAGGPDVTGIYLGSLDGSPAIRLAPDASPPQYLTAATGEPSSDNGWLLRAQGKALVAQRLDLDRSALVGDPVMLADLVQDSSPSSTAGWSVAAPGLLAYRPGTLRQRQLTWVDRSGTVQGTVGEPDDSLIQPRVSPDGRRVAVSRTVGGNADLWLLDGARISRLTFDPSLEVSPVWSPDGTRIVFGSARTGALDLYQTRTNGSGGEERIVASDLAMAPSSWSPDGRFLLYVSLDPQTYTDLWVVPMAGDHTPSVFLQTPFREAQCAFSPDGRWVAYQSNESGRMEIYVRPFLPPGSPSSAAVAPAPAAAGQWQISTAGGIIPAWRPDGKELYYLNPAGDMMAVPITVVGATLDPGAAAALFPTHIVGGGVNMQLLREYDVAPDGRFLINTELPGDAAPITLIQHWTPEAKR